MRTKTVQGVTVTEADVRSCIEHVFASRLGYAGRELTEAERAILEVANTYVDEVISVQVERAYQRFDAFDARDVFRERVKDECKPCAEAQAACEACA